MATKTDHGGFGAVRFPAPAVGSAQDLDPGQIAILELLEAAINAELGTAWCSIVATLRDEAKLRQSRQPVEFASTMELTPQEMTQVVTAWPLLAVYRQGEPEFDQLTLEYDKLTQQWSVDYVIGPLSAAHKVKIGRFCNSVAKLIWRTLDRGYHSAYKGGARQFLGQFTSIKATGVQGPGVAQSLGEESGSGYYGMTVLVETVEREVYDDVAQEGAFETDTGYVPLGTGTAPPLTAIESTLTLVNDDPSAQPEE